MSRAPLSKLGGRASSGRKAYKKIPAEEAPSNLPHITKIVTTTSSRFNISALDWNLNDFLLSRMKDLKGKIDDVNKRLNITVVEPQSRTISSLSLGNLSATSVTPLFAPVQSVQIFTSPSGLSFVQANIRNDDMDTSLDFFIPPQRIPSPLDTIMSDPVLDSTVSPVPIAESAKSKMNIEKAELRLRLRPPQDAKGYRQFQRKIVKDLGAVVPVLYFLTLGNRDLTIAIGYVRGDGWAVSSVKWGVDHEVIRSHWPSDASRLVSDCFNQVVEHHNMKIFNTLGAGQQLKDMNRVLRTIEPCSLSPLLSKLLLTIFTLGSIDMLRGAHFLAEIGLIQDRLNFHKFTGPYLTRVISSGTHYFKTSRPLLDPKAKLITTPNPAPPPANPVPTPAKPKRSKGASLVTDAELKSGMVEMPSFGEMMDGLENMTVVFKNIQDDPLAGVRQSYSY